MLSAAEIHMPEINDMLSEQHVNSVWGMNIQTTTPSAIAPTAQPLGGAYEFLAPIGPIAENSIPISSADDLARIGLDALFPPDGNFHLTQDIDLAGIVWNQINLFNFGGDPSSGIFDGRGHIIRNLTITGDMDVIGERIGLFGTTLNATIKNVGLDGVYINISTSPWGSGHIGATVGHATNTEISNVFSSGVINISRGNASPMHVSVGGIVGSSFNGSMEFVYNTSSIVVDTRASNVGGIAGGLSGEVSNAFNTGHIYVIAAADGNTFAGGLIGNAGDFDGTQFGSQFSIFNSYNAGDISEAVFKTS